jgi:hypothetical protein
VRVPFVLLLVAVLASPAAASEASRDLGDGAARIAGPAAGWTAREATPAAGQSVLRIEAPGGTARVEAWVFPAEPGEANPAAVLTQAVGRWIQALHGPTGPVAGMPTRRDVRPLGCPGAEATLSSRWRDAPARGNARLLRLSEHQWAFAVGLAAASDAAASEEVARLVGSLAPAAPRFVDPTFRLTDLDAPLTRTEGELPVRREDLFAVERVLEAAIGVRLPLQEREALRRTLSADLAQGSARTRAGYREVGAAVRALEGRDPAEREATLAAVGGRVLRAVIERAQAEQYAPAVALATWLDRAERIVVGEPGTGLPLHAVESLVEHAAFLATIAGDRTFEPATSDVVTLRDALRDRWDALPEPERTLLRQAGRSWARLRRAYDLATPAARLGFRREVAVRLAGDAPVPGTTEAPALKEWMDALDAPAREARFQRAAALRVAQRDALTALLEVEGDDGAFGW